MKRILIGFLQVDSEVSPIFLFFAVKRRFRESASANYGASRSPIKSCSMEVGALGYVFHNYPQAPCVVPGRVTISYSHCPHEELLDCQT